MLREEEKVVLKGAKEYDPTYIWGQLSGWYKQSVDKPNASLSADRRGTLAYPDLESFNIDRSLKKSKRPRTKKKNKDYAYDNDMKELSEDGSSKTRKPRKEEKKIPKSVFSLNQPSITEDDIKEGENPQSYTPVARLGEDDLPPVPIFDGQVKDSDSEIEDLCIYPNKKHTKREEFMKAWKNSFSKQWDAVCKWNFKNKQKMYGSIQFESLVKAGLRFDNVRLEYFHNIVDDLLSFKRG